MVKFEQVRWLDDNGYIKPPLMLYCLLVFLGRGWCVLVASLTQSNDRAALVRLIYPNPIDFKMALLTGIGALIIYVFIIFERKRKFNQLSFLFQYLRHFLIGLLLVDILLLTQRIIYNQYLFDFSYAFEMLGLFWGLLYAWKSLYLRYYAKDWIQGIDQKSVR